MRSELSTMQTLNKSLDTQLKARVFELEVETEAHASMKKLMGDEIDTLTNSLFTVREEKTITESRLKEELDSVIKTSGAEAKEIARVLNCYFDIFCAVCPTFAQGLLTVAIQSLCVRS